MPRSTMSIRLSPVEKQLLRTAAKREDRSMAALIREEALRHAMAVLEQELERNSANSKGTPQK